MGASSVSLRKLHRLGSPVQSHDHREEVLPMSERKQPVPGLIVLRHVGGDDWRFLGEVERRRGLPARAARSQAIFDATDGAARPGAVYAAILRSDWRVSLDWKHPST